MTNITFSVDDELHKKMKAHSEIKWTEILRQAIIEYLKKVEDIDVLSIEDFRKRMGPEIQKKVEALTEKDEIAFYKEAKRLEEERLKRLESLERSLNE
jgi:tetrahydromethanopterin S-methyltransferase subunit A